MPPALAFQSGRRCGPAETCSTRRSRSRRYARSMSLTMIAMCWNERSLLRASGGIGRPRGARYSVSSIASSPSRRRTTRMRSPNTPSRCSYCSPASSTSDTGSKVRTSVKKRTERSMSDTVIPTESTARTSALPAQAGAATASIRTAARAAERRPHIIASAEPLPQVIAHPERVRHDGERRVHRAARGEEAGVDDVEVVDLVRLAARVERRRPGVRAEADGAVLVCDAGERDATRHVGLERDQVMLLALDVLEQALELRRQSPVRLVVVRGVRQPDPAVAVDGHAVPGIRNSCRRHPERHG